MSLGPIAHNTNKYEAICNDCSCGVREMKVDYKVSDQALKSKQVHLVKKGGLGLGLRGLVWDSCGWCACTIFLKGQCHAIWQLYKS